MRNISDDFKNKLNESVLTLAKCWKIKLLNGKILTFTNHDKDIEFQGEVYSCVSGFENSYLNGKSEVEYNDGSIVSIFDNDLIKEDDLITGQYNNAEVEIFVINYEEPNMGKVLLFSGFLGNTTTQDGKFYAKLKGLESKLEKTVGDIYSPLCRGKFCDERCKLNVDEYTFNGTIYSVVNNGEFYCDDTEIKEKEENYFDYGIITFKNGLNQGLSGNIKQFNGGNFVLNMEMPFDIKENDKFTVIAGCNKNFSTCCTKYNNAINFRGEPHLPGVDIVLSTY